MKVLVIEDDERTAAFTLKGLKESGYVVHHAADGTKGLLLAGSERYDALIVDRMLPGRDGLELIAILRAAGNRTPALILSALGSVNDRVRGLKAGDGGEIAVMASISLRLCSKITKWGTTSSRRPPRREGRSRRAT